MSTGDRRRPTPQGFMAAAAYLTIVGVAVKLMFRESGELGLSGSTIVFPILVLLFGASLPLGRKPWASTHHGYTVTIIFDFALLSGLLFLSPYPWLPGILLFVFLPVSSRLGPPLRYACYVTAPLMVVAAFASHGDLTRDWSSLLSMAAGFVAVIVFSESYRAVRESSQESRRLLDELVKAQGQLHEAAVSEERQRLAKEMHDAVGHRLTVASIQLEAVSKLMESDPARAGELVAVSRDQVRAGLAELRAAVNSLSSLEPSNLSRRIEETVAAFRKGSSIKATTDIDPGVDNLDAACSLVILRSVQEGLTNVQRHSSATKVHVRFAIDNDDRRAELVVQDNGSGAARNESDAVDESGGFGLPSLRNRAEGVGGSVAFSRSETGSRLQVTLPVARA